MSIQEAAEAMVAATELENNPNEELSINEEYQLWRKNCRYMYEFVSETALTWPSLTIQWLPDYTSTTDAYEASLILGTHTSGEDTNYLKVAAAQIPRDGSNTVQTRLKITKKYGNNHEINRARYMPQNLNVIATINGVGEVDFYDRSLETKSPSVHYTPHLENGFGLSWSLHHEGYLLTASDDKSAIVTDYSQVANPSKAQIFKTTVHSDIVNDAKWHSHDANVFGSVSDDNRFRLFDIRAPNAVSTYHDQNAGGINTVSFSPFSHHLVALGNGNSNIGLIDSRKLGLVHTMMGHSDGITAMEFSPHKDGILASGSQDRRVILWDLFKVGEEQAQEDAEDGCPELFMMHAGHTGAVMDVTWCPYKDWTLGSVADDNIVHLWQVGLSLLDDSDVAVQPSQLE